MTTSSSSTLTVSEKLSGQRIDVVLATLLPQYSRSQLSSWLKLGLITVNGKHIKPKEKVFAASSIEIPENWPEHQDINQTCLAEDIPLNIIYEDPYLIIINKPPGLVVHPGAGNKDHTLVNALLHHAPQLHELPRAGIIHRLDKDTTGLLVIAKTLTAYTSLVRQMQAREIKRHYLGLVLGHVISGGTIDTLYGRHPHNRLKMTVGVGKRQAITHYRVSQHYQAYFTLLNITLETGRTHQIRVHMHHINHPIFGDPLYGKRPKIPTELAEDLQKQLLSFNRQALHASTLTLTHPEHHETLTFTAALPDDLQTILTILDNYLA
ncbi:MAG: RNA pseudouridine synthase [Legionellales bacterium RIFCSPHIGHO2_12_FULL_42_9]|nr:MAG: RNA pseudouridine synthase [Legionellales bacterium RIFCSPHIGHO2_12_FULL_42_9]